MESELYQDIRIFLDDVRKIIKSSNRKNTKETVESLTEKLNNPNEMLSRYPNIYHNICIDLETSVYNAVSSDKTFLESKEYIVHSTF